MVQKLQWLYVLATLTLIFGALPLFANASFGRVLYAVGAVAYALYYLLYHFVNQELSLLKKRIIRLNTFASVLLIISAVARFGYLDRYGQNLWIFFLGLALIFIVYANILLLRNKEQ